MTSTYVTLNFNRDCIYHATATRANENKKSTQETEKERERKFFLFTDNMQISKLRLRCHSVYLTHIAALILLLHVRYMQEPGLVLIVLVMCHRYSWVPRNYVIMHRQYRRLLKVHPSNLRKRDGGGKEIIRCVISNNNINILS
jgi:hypothetical protein